MTLHKSVYTKFTEYGNTDKQELNELSLKKLSTKVWVPNHNKYQIHSAIIVTVIKIPPQNIYLSCKNRE